MRIDHGSEKGSNPVNPSHMEDRLLWTIIVLSPVMFVLMFLTLGFVTPGYDHLAHTVSRLVLGRFGWIQQLNFLQFAVGFFVSARLYRDVLVKSDTKLIWSRVFLFCGACLMLLILFPTDPVERFRWSRDLLTPRGFAHFATLTVFFVLSPVWIRRMGNSLRLERNMSDLARFTEVMGYTSFVLCIVWIALWVSGIGLGYRGLIQKVIISVCIIWMLRMHISVSNRKVSARFH